MGGHGHNHHKAPYEIPDYKIYKIEDAPELVRTQKALASIGLKDPWLRNEVWRYDPRVWGTRKERQISAFTRGLRTGLVLLGVTLVGTYVYDKMVPSKHGHGHDGH